MVGSGDAGLIEVLDVPEHLRGIAPEGLAALSFLTDDFDRAQRSAREYSNDVTVFDTARRRRIVLCTMGGVPIVFMGSYVPERTRRPLTQRTLECVDGTRCVDSRHRRAAPPGRRDRSHRHRGYRRRRASTVDSSPAAIVSPTSSASPCSSSRT